MSFQHPPRKRICLNFNHYTIPQATEDKISHKMLPLTKIGDSLPHFVVPQRPIHSIVTEKPEGPLNCFYIFRWLPKELQLQIWETAAAAIDAQIITISRQTQRIQALQQVNQYHQSRAYVHNETVFLAAQYIVPNILHACGDARDVALKYYRPVLAREIGGAPIYMAIDERRTPDTFLFDHLTALQMLRSRTQNFRIMRNDMDFITSAIVCVDIDNQPYNNPHNLRWVTSSLRGAKKLWIAEEVPCTCVNHSLWRARIVKNMECILADVMISQYATSQQKEALIGYVIHAEAIKCMENPEYSFKKYGFRVPKARVTSVDQLKMISGQVVGRREQSRVTLEYLHKI